MVTNTACRAESRSVVDESGRYRPSVPWSGPFAAAATDPFVFLADRLSEIEDRIERIVVLVEDKPLRMNDPIVYFKLQSLSKNSLLDIHESIHRLMDFCQCMEACEDPDEGGVCTETDSAGESLRDVRWEFLRNTAIGTQQNQRDFTSDTESSDGEEKPVFRRSETIKKSVLYRPFVRASHSMISLTQSRD